MAKMITGIDIGARNIKFAVCDTNEVKKTCSFPLPENMVKGGVVISDKAMGDVIKAAVKENKISARQCSVLLPDELSFFRRLTIPAMTEAQLKINLPFEFHDFITLEKEKYFYDYAVANIKYNENGEAYEYDLMAAAAEKTAIENYSSMMRSASLKLSKALPYEFAYSNIIRKHEQISNEKKEYCIIDLGHTATRVHLYTGANYETTRIIEYGGETLDNAISETLNIDKHIALTYKERNHENVQNLDVCINIYQTIATEILRAVNFYNFNNPDSTLEDAYLCGGGALISPLAEAIKNTLSLKIHSIAELLPENSQEEKNISFAAAIGAAL